MVSGIGSKSILDSLSIPVISDLQGVGQNLQDHPYVCISHRVNVITNSREIGDPVFAAQVRDNYYNNASGPLTSPFAGPLGWEKVRDLSVPIPFTI